jgi:hypothetical protein
MGYVVFRELRYGVWFFLSAMIGMFVGVSVLVPPVRSGAIDYQIHQDVIAAVIGAIGGCVAWLVYRYNFLTQPK